MTGLTLRQAQVLAHIEACVAKDGRPPSGRDICAAMGFVSTNAAHEHVQRLVAKDRICVAATRHRGITVIKPLTYHERIKFELGTRKAERGPARPVPPTHRLVPLSRCSVCSAAVLGDVCPMCRAEVAA